MEVKIKKKVKKAISRLATLMFPGEFKEEPIDENTTVKIYITPGYLVLGGNEKDVEIVKEFVEKIQIREFFKK